MPGPVLTPNPAMQWLQEGPSVMDSKVQQALRMLASIIGADSAESQAMGLGMAGQLDLSHAARMARAKALGFTQDVFHGTQAKTSWMDDPNLMAMFNRGEDIPDALAQPQAIREFRSRTGGLKMMDGMGVHTGTPEAATQRLEQNVGQKFGTPTRPVPAGQLEGSYVLPLKGRAQKPFVKANGEPFSESELQSKLSAIAKKLGYTDTRRYSPRSGVGNLPAAQRAVKQYLQEQGYDSIPYINSHEARGSVSWIFLEPNQLRSRFAAFDPDKIGSSDLLAGLAGLGVLGGAIQDK